MNFKIIYHTAHNDRTSYAHTAEDAYARAYAYMSLHSDIEQTTIIDTHTGRVLRIYAR